MAPPSERAGTRGGKLDVCCVVEIARGMTFLNWTYTGESAMPWEGR
jgi:hypothetical protein